MLGDDQKYHFMSLKRRFFTHNIEDAKRLITHTQLYLELNHSFEFVDVSIQV